MDNFFSKKYFYLIRIQFIGFRYHGWQKQSHVKTVQLMVDKTIAYILDHKNFKTLGCSRTDAMVSAKDFAFELFCYQELDDQFLNNFNENLPPDIRALSVQEVDEQFNIIKSAKLKEYHYQFSYGAKSHPFNAPFITHIHGQLDMGLMMEGAKIFQGIHNFHSYCYQPGPKTILEREILISEIVDNEFRADFAPASSYLFRIKGAGFLRHQVRIMMGTLFELGKGAIDLDQVKNTMVNSTVPIGPVAPASGLVLHKVDFL
jgi:tRNA pseudouridine38-40 synthase